MIPTVINNGGQFVLRKFSARFDAGRLGGSPGFGSVMATSGMAGGSGIAHIARLLFLLAVAFVTLLTLPHLAAGAMPLVFVLGNTTGTKTGTGDFSGLNDMMKETYTKAFENNIEAEQEVADCIGKAEGFDVIEGQDGKQIHVGHIFSSGGGVGSILEDDYLIGSSNPTTKQSTITIKQHIAIAQLSGRALRRVKQGPAAFVTWASDYLPRKARRLAFHLDRQRLGTGTGIIARMNGAPDGTGDPMDTMFGVSGLDDRPAMLVLRDDLIRIGPNADGSSLRTGNLQITAVHYDTKAIDTALSSAVGTPATATSAADNDYIFLGDGNVQSAGVREMMGLEGIIDDGTNLSTFQGVTRASFPELNSQIIDSTAAGWDTTLSEEILDYADGFAWERGNEGRPSTVLVNRSGQRSFWKNMKNDRVLNDPAGMFKGGRAKLRMMLGDRVVTLQQARKVPASRCYGIDGTGIQRFKIGSGRWDDTDGSVWNRVVDSTGRKDAFFAVYVLEEEMGAGNPAGSFKITGLAEA